MQQHLSKQAEQHGLCFDICLARSRQKWAEGLRSDHKKLPPDMCRWLISRYGQTFLFSTYMGAECVVVTTPKGLHGMMATELPFHEALVDWHRANSSLFMATV